MNIFDDEIDIIKREPKKSSSIQCDIFDPSVYASDSSKFRAEYIKQITAKVKFELDTEDLAKEVPEGEVPKILLETFGKDPEKTFKLIFKYLRGPRGFTGGLDNFVLLSESEYNRLQVKDPNVIYCTYDDEEESSEHIEGSVLKGGTINNTFYKSKGKIINNILKLS